MKSKTFQFILRSLGIIIAIGSYYFESEYEYEQSYNASHIPDKLIIKDSIFIEKIRAMHLKELDSLLK